MLVFNCIYTCFGFRLLSSPLLSAKESQTKQNTKTLSWYWIKHSGQFLSRHNALFKVRRPWNKWQRTLWCLKNTLKMSISHCSTPVNNQQFWSLPLKCPENKSKEPQNILHVVSKWTILMITIIMFFIFSDIYLGIRKMILNKQPKKLDSE